MVDDFVGKCQNRRNGSGRKRIVIGKRGFFVLSLVLLAVGYFYVLAVGNTYVAKAPRDGGESEELIAWISEDSIGDLEILEIKDLGSEWEIKVKSLKPGRVFLTYPRGESEGIVILYVHKNGVITQGDYFGNCTGSFMLRLVWVLWLFLLLMELFQAYRRSVRRNRYLYKNILYCGLIIFIIYVLFIQTMGLTVAGGAIDVLYKFTTSLTAFGIFAFLPMLIVFVTVTISNFQLIRKEGRNWRNLLGAILGILMVILCIAPSVVGSFFQRTKLIDVHNWRGTGRFVGMFIENFFGMGVIYLDCILLGTIILSVKAARHVPAFDKDYVLIHGSMIRKDGTLTKLLQSRADRALEFDEMQRKATGKELIFVPSGGKGSDEIISEAEAISRYLQEKGIPKERILLEDQSKNTEENIVNSVKLIRERENGREARIALSTTNYHVFRAGLLAANQGVDIEGIGSKTKSYFWINAFVREFIATLSSERWTHVAVLGILTLFNLAMVLMTYVSNVVLS